MRTRFSFTLALVLVAAFPAFAQRPNEGHPSEGPHEQGQHGPEAHGPNTPRANQGHVPAPPPQRESHAKPELEHRPNGKINSSQHVNNDHWYAPDSRTTSAFTWITRLRTVVLNISGPPIATALRASTVTIITSGFPGATTLKLLPGTGRLPPIGAGTVAMTS